MNISIDDVLNEYVPVRTQVSRDGKLLPIWLGETYVVKYCFLDQVRLDIELAHIKLGKINRCSRLIRTFPDINVIVEERIYGTSLDQIAEDLADLAIVGFYKEAEQRGLRIIEYDSNPENYILDVTDGRVKCIDLGDTFFED